MNDALMQGAEQEFVIACIATVAEYAHQVNKGLCEGLGDFSQPDWNDAPDWQQQSAIDGVVHVLKNPDTTPEQSHKNWMAQKVRDGWVYGAEKNVDLKMHPCMVSYDKLPEAQRLKDHVYLAVVKHGLKIFMLA